MLSLILKFIIKFRLNIIMQKNIFKYFFIILLNLFFITIPQKVSSAEKNNNFIEYIKKIPKNNYILGNGDILEIRFNKLDNKPNNIYQISRQGTVKLPNIGEIFIRGLTINELESTLDKVFSDYIFNINTKVNVKTFRPIRVYINGEINVPGMYQLSGAISTDVLVDDIIKNSTPNTIFNSENLLKTSLEINNNYLEGPQNYFPTLFDAIREAGGITSKSNLREVKIVRINSISEGGGRKQTIINFEDVLEGNNEEGNLRIYDGDSVYIPKSEKSQEVNLLKKSFKTNLNPRFIKVLVGGRVESPGVITAANSNTLNDAIDIAGGTKFLKGKVKFLRINNDGTFEKRLIRFSSRNRRGSYHNPYLSSNDMIIVGKSAFNITSEILKEFTSPFRDIFSSYALYKAFSE